MKRGRHVLIWRVDVCYLTAEAWKYEGSKAGEGRGGRTHTFGVKKPKERFQHAIVYQAPKIVIRQGAPTMGNGED